MACGKIKKLGGKYAEDIGFIEKICFSDPWSISMIEAGMASGSSIFYGSFCDDRLIGYISALYTDEFCEILNLAVLPQYRGMGRAKELIGKIYSDCLKKKIKKIFLEVRESADAYFLYKNEGFSEYSRRKDYYKNPKEDAILMMKEVL